MRRSYTLRSESAATKRVPGSLLLATLLALTLGFSMGCDDEGDPPPPPPPSQNWDQMKWDEGRWSLERKATSGGRFLIEIA